MEEKKIFNSLIRYACDILSFEERRSMSIEDFYEYVKKHFIPIHKDELIPGLEYTGNVYSNDIITPNYTKAIWNGSEFSYTKYMFVSCYESKAKHFEDDDNNVFIPIKEV